MNNHSTPRITDGTYTYRCVQPYGQSVQTTVVVHDGTLFDFITGTGSEARSVRGEFLAQLQGRAFAELALYAAHGKVQRVDETASVAA